MSCNRGKAEGIIRQVISLQRVSEIAAPIYLDKSDIVAKGASSLKDNICNKSNSTVGVCLILAILADE